MVTLRTIDLKSGLKNVSDIIKSGEQVLVVRPYNQNFVIISEAEYKGYLKTQKELDTLHKEMDSKMSTDRTNTQ